MTERTLPSEGLDFRRLFPWVHLFRSFRLALRIRQILLAALGLLLATGGMRVIDGLIETRELPSAGFSRHDWPWNTDLGFRGAPSVYPPSDGDRHATTPGERPLDAVAALAEGLSEPWGLVQTVFSNWSVTLLPVRDLLQDAQVMFRPDASFSEARKSLVLTGWWLLVWSLIGGAVSRSAAVEFAREQSTHLPGAIQFAGRRYLSYLAGPLLPVAGIALLWGLCAIGGLVGRAGESVGPAILGILWGLLLVFGVMLAVVVMGLACGWPLMFATISVEGTDGFDGMSRAYNYVYERPMYYVWQILLMLVYGSFAVFCVLYLSQFTLRMAVWGTAWGGNAAGVRLMVEQAPPLLAPPRILTSAERQELRNDQIRDEQKRATARDRAAEAQSDSSVDADLRDQPGGEFPRPDSGSGEIDDDLDVDEEADVAETDDGSMPGVDPVASDRGRGSAAGRRSLPAKDPEISWSRRFTRFWMCLLATMTVAFVYSFFWSGATTIYFILRHSVDGNDFDEVYLSDAVDPDNLLPLVGAAAMGVDLAGIGSAPPADDPPPDNPPYPVPPTS